MRRDEREPIRVQVEPNSVIAAAREHGEVSAGRVGNSINSSGLPVIQTEVRLGFPYIFDIIPNLAGSRVINLSAAADKAHTACLMTSYDATVSSEQAFAGQGPGLEQTPQRSHALLVQFGAGNVRHNFEIDVSEGSVANVPGSHVEVTLLDYTHVRGYAGFDTPSASRLTSHANLAAFGHPFNARLTTPVYCPFQTVLDMAAPPLLDDYLQALVNANQNGDVILANP